MRQAGRQAETDRQTDRQTKTERQKNRKKEKGFKNQTAQQNGTRNHWEARSVNEGQGFRKENPNGGWKADKHCFVLNQRNTRLQTYIQMFLIKNGGGGGETEFFL